MEAVIIVIHLMVIVALIAVVLLQRSEGGALGIGSSNAFLTSRGQGNVLTRATTILGIAFFVTSVALTLLTRLQPAPADILNNVTATPAAAGTTAPATTKAPLTTTGILNSLTPPGTAATPAGTVTSPTIGGVALPAPAATTPSPATTTAPATTPATSTAPTATTPATPAPATPAPAAPATPAQ